MEIYEIKNNIAEKLFETKKTPFSVILITNRYYLSYCISGNKNFLLKALNYCIAGFNNNTNNIDLYFLVSFLYIELDEISKAEDLLNSLEINKNSLRSSDAKSYVKYIYLLTYAGVLKGNLKNLNKMRKIFKSELEEDFDKKLYTYLGLIELECGNYTEAAECFNISFNEKSNQLFLLIGLLKYFKKSEPVFNNNIFFTTINWALSQGFDLQLLLPSYKEYLKDTSDEKIFFYKRLYLKYSENYILKILCSKYFNSLDTSLDSYNFLVKGYKKDILSVEEINHLVYTAFSNDVRDLNKDIVIRYLKNNKNIKIDLKSYVLFMFLKTVEKEETINEFKTNLIQLAVYGLEREIKNDYYLLLYNYFLINYKEFKINENLIKLAENIIEPFLFAYDITINNKMVKHVWIKRYTTYIIDIFPVKDGKAKIFSATSDFDLFFLNLDKNRVLKSEYNISKILSYNNLGLYIYFYNKGISNQDLNFALSDYLIKTENVSEDNIEVFNKSLEFSQISQEFKSKIILSAGNVLYKNNKFEDALKYFYLIKDKNVIDEKHIEPMLLAFINKEDFDSAIDLMLKKGDCIKDKNMFFAVKEIIKKSDKSSVLSNICYDLLISGWYDKLLVEMIISNYRGELSKWIDLNKKIEDVSEFGPTIDEIILNKSMYLKKVNEEIEKVFKRVYEKNNSKKIVEDYLYFLNFNILIENFEPTIETLSIIENYFLNTKNSLASLAIAKIYVNLNITTSRSKDILSIAIFNMEQDNILLPSIKKFKDKNIMTSYIEKNQPFIYRTIPGKKVFLHYKFSDENDFIKKQMNYFKFGIYLVNIIMFYGEKITFFISEEIESGSTMTKENVIVNDQISIGDFDNDKFYLINQIVLNEKYQKYDEVYKAILLELKEENHVKAKLI